VVIPVSGVPGKRRWVTGGVEWLGNRYSKVRIARRIALLTETRWPISVIATKAFIVASLKRMGIYRRRSTSRGCKQDRLRWSG
jgi:hypothetical protein